MKAKFKLILILVGLTAMLSSCRTSAPRLDYQALARASILLGVDINMEDMDGLKAAMKIKEEYPKLPVVLVTAYMNYALDGYR